MANKKNLKQGNPETQFTSGRVAVENGSKGGKAAAKNKREKKAMKETLGTLLNMSLKEGTITDIEKITNVASLKGLNISVQEAIMLAQIQKALKGDTKAAEYIRDTSGNKLKDGLELSGGINNPFAGLSTKELKKLVDDE